MRDGHKNQPIFSTQKQIPTRGLQKWCSSNMKKDVRRKRISEDPGGGWVNIKPENRNEAKKEEFLYRLMISTSRRGNDPLILFFLFCN